ncbi:MAG TPA: pentapeptide repeat-containing protein [Candidatus Obscuribacterales bacterium]
MTTQPDSSQSSPPPDSPNGTRGNNASQALAPAATSQQQLYFQSPNNLGLRPNSRNLQQPNFLPPWITLTAIAIMALGLLIDNSWIGMSGAIVALVVSLRVVLPALITALDQLMLPQQRSQLLALIAGFIALAGLLKFIGFYHRLGTWSKQINWEASGTLAEWTGAVGQIFIAILAVYIAWQQYVISRDLTIEQNRLTTQQNTLTQQQTIDAYFQGISELALDDQGFLEDWPQEQAFAEGRTAALLGSIDANGKAKVLRFLSQSKLLTPLKRDRRLGRPILDGDGGYAEDRLYGVRVIDLGVMLAGADLSGTDLRWTDLSEANLVKANLRGCDLVKANLSRTILYEATLANADIKGSRLFYGSVETASPRSRSEPPNYKTGAHTGAVVENADFSNIQELSEDQRYYCCAWGGEQTRTTIPGGCEGIPNKLGR